MEISNPAGGDPSTRQCWICLGVEGETESADAGPFIKLCSCTLQSHESCLMTWLIATGKAAPGCPQCGTKIVAYRSRQSHRVFMDLAGRVLASVAFGGVSFLVLRHVGGAYVRAVYAPEVADRILGVLPIPGFSSAANIVVKVVNSLVVAAMPLVLIRRSRMNAIEAAAPDTQAEPPMISLAMMLIDRASPIPLGWGSIMTAGTMHSVYRLMMDGFVFPRMGHPPLQMAQLPDGALGAFNAEQENQEADEEADEEAGDEAGNGAAEEAVEEESEIEEHYEDDESEDDGWVEEHEVNGQFVPVETTRRRRSQLSQAELEAKFVEAFKRIPTVEAKLSGIVEKFVLELKRIPNWRYLPANGLVAVALLMGANVVPSPNESDATDSDDAEPPLGDQSMLFSYAALLHLYDELYSDPNLREGWAEYIRSALSMLLLGLHAAVTDESLLMDHITRVILYWEPLDVLQYDSRRESLRHVLVATRDLTFDAFYAIATGDYIWTSFNPNPPEPADLGRAIYYIEGYLINFKRIWNTRPPVLRVAPEDFHWRGIREGLRLARSHDESEEDDQLDDDDQDEDHQNEDQGGQHIFIGPAGVQVIGHAGGQDIVIGHAADSDSDIAAEGIAAPMPAARPPDNRGGFLLRSLQIAIDHVSPLGADSIAAWERVVPILAFPYIARATGYLISFMWPLSTLAIMNRNLVACGLVIVTNDLIRLGLMAYESKGRWYLTRLDSCDVNIQRFIEEEDAFGI